MREYEGKDKFGSWQVPLVYTSVEEEYRMVRERVGIADYSLMPRLGILGKDARRFVQKVLANDVNKISPGRVLYSEMLDETGRVITDGTLFWIEDDCFYFVYELVDIIEWLQQHARGLDVYIVDLPPTLLTIQGPKSREILQKVVNVQDLSYYSWMKGKINDIPVLIGRLGYTGEIGYELYTKPQYAGELWDTIIEIGREYNIGPYGFDTMWLLGMEKGYKDYTMDYYEGATPLEVGQGWTIAFDKEENFVGKKALMRRKAEGLKTKLMGIEVSDPKVPISTGDSVVKGKRKVGQVTRTVYSPFAGKNIGYAWVEIGLANEGEELETEHERERAKIRLVQGRWYDPENKKLKG